jgi:pseudoazurin
MKFLIYTLALLYSGNLALAADTTIEMRNKIGKESMVYSKKIIKINLGDTVFWKSVDKGHNVEFIKKKGVPKGVKKFKSKVSKNTQYTFKIPGIYAYWCTPHKNMGMIGFIIVGDNLDNLESIKKIKYRGKSKRISKRLIKKIVAS